MTGSKIINGLESMNDRFAHADAVIHRVLGEFAESRKRHGRPCSESELLALKMPELVARVAELEAKLKEKAHD